MQPLLDDLTIGVNAEIDRLRSETAAELELISDSVQTLNGPFECFALAYKPSAAASTPDDESQPA